MGWTGSFIYWNKKDTNKDLLVRAFPSLQKELDEGTRKLSQKGSDVYMLFKCNVKGEYFGKWWVACYLCRREKGGEFMTKDIDAISNHCFDFPKSWIDLLDKTDTEVQEYIKAREEWENKQKSKVKFEIGDYVKSVTSYDITWSGFKINKGDVFYIHIQCLNPWANKKTKAYVITKPHSNWKGEWQMVDDNYRIKGSTFNNLESAIKLSEEDVRQIVKAEKQKEIA